LIVPLYYARLQNIHKVILQSAVTDGGRRIAPLALRSYCLCKAAERLCGCDAACKMYISSFCNKGKYISKNLSSSANCADVQACFRQTRFETEVPAVRFQPK